MLILLLFFFCAILIQIVYFMIIFSRLIFYKEPQHTGKPNVSVIICAHNELKNLQKLLPQVMSQQYPVFEVIIADDRSDDGTKKFIQTHYKDYSRLKYLYIDRTPVGMNPKKYALTRAIEKAAGEVILLTDADCLPASGSWISEMMKSMGQGKEIVLGYSPYQEKKGFLNKLIRFETFYTAVQYLSLALAGKPYMGVGRNLAYRKKLFLENKGFNSHIHRTGGDDDLFIRDIARAGNTGIRLSAGSRVYSYPKESYPSWLRQKIRHLHAGKKYKFSDKLILGTLFTSQLLYYIPLLVLLADFTYSPFIIAGFVLRTGLLISIFVQITLKTGERFAWYWFPILDFFNFLNQIIAGAASMFSKRIKWI